MTLTAAEIGLLLKALSHQYGFGYSQIKEVAQLQAKLSVMLQVKQDMEETS